MIEKKKKLKEGYTDQKLKLISNCFSTLEYLLRCEKKPFRVLINNLNYPQIEQVCFDNEFVQIIQQFMIMCKHNDIIFK